MENLTQLGVILEINTFGSMTVKSLPTKDAGYHGEMILHTGETEIYDHFGQKMDVSFLEKGQLIEFETNGIMTMSLPPQINPIKVKKLYPVVEFEARVESIEDALCVKVTDAKASFVSGLILINNTNENTLILKEDNTFIDFTDLNIDDEVEVMFDGVMTRSLPPQINALRLFIKDKVVS